MKHLNWIQKSLRQLRKYSDRWWYLPLVAFLSAVDAYIVIVPNEALLVTAVLAHPKRWIAIAFAVTLGSAVGAASFAALVNVYGIRLVELVMHDAVHSKTWAESATFLQDHSLWGLTAISFSPFPQHAAVAIAGLAGVPWLTVLIAVFVGRLVKYLLVAWGSIHSPKLLRKWKLI